MRRAAITLPAKKWIARIVLCPLVAMVVVTIFALVGCGGGRSVSSTGSKAKRDQIALEEDMYAEEHRNDYSGCSYARNVRRSDVERGIPARRDSYMLKGADKVCRTWKKEQREKDPR